jgi:hypothetical protein
MSIRHMMAPDYYGTPLWGYDTFVTMSSKRSVATHSWIPPQMDAGHAAQIYVQTNYGDRTFWFAGIRRIRHGKISQANWTFWPASRPGGPFIWQLPSFGQGMMIAEVNIAIGAIDRILKTTKHGRSNNRELTNARAELDHWRARLLKTVHKCKDQPKGLT